MKIALGTAQFGMDYGINNKRGKIPDKEIFSILDEAYSAGIDILDTAGIYGQSESIIGRFIKNSGKKFNIVSKVIGTTSEEVKRIFEDSLDVLGIENLYGYLIHHIRDYEENPDIWKVLEKLRDSGRIKKIGFSLYSPIELELLAGRGIKFDIMQVPYSIFDRRFESCFERLKKAGVEIHTRSVFLQGLVFKKPSDLTGIFLKIKDKISALDKLSKNWSAPISSICLNFAIGNEFIDKVVVGVDGIDNFKEIHSFAGNFNYSANDLAEISLLAETDERIIIPANWKRE